MRTSEYVNRLHVVGMATLAVLTAGLALTGWALRPASAGFSEVPTNFQLGFYAVPSGAPIALALTRTGDGGGADLLVNGPVSVPGGAWVLYVFGLGPGHLCTPATDLVSLGPTKGFISVKVPRQHLKRLPPLLFEDPHPRPQPPSYEVAARGPLYVQLCWGSSSPMIVNGAYLTARFPSTFSSGPAGATSLRLTRQLNLGAGNTSDYAVQSLTQPTSVTYGGWQWSKVPAGSPISFAAINTSVTQHDSYQAFLSGVFFGVAGGALVALVQEVVAPFRSRRELRPPEPGG
jgi:hypothetical protein